MQLVWKKIGLILVILLVFVQAQAQEAEAYIVYVSTAAGSEEIFVTNLSHSVTYNLTNARSRDWHPSWSPDGRRIAFATDRDGNTEIYVMSANGSDPVNVTQNVAGDSSPDWSPVADEIAFISERDGGYDIYILNLAENNTQRLTTDGAPKSDPAWSPDGSQIVYWQQVSGSSVELRTIDVMTGTVTTRRSDGQSLWPAWSPDSRHIAYYSQESGQAEIYAINLGDGGVVNLTNAPSNDARPAWSPSGGQIAFMSDRSGDFNLYIMNADGSASRQLTTSPENDHSPDWQPVPASIDFSNTAFGQNNNVVDGPIDPEAQRELGVGKGRVRAPTSVNVKDLIRVRFEVELDAQGGVATPMPTPEIPVRDERALSLYRFMGAELAGIHLSRFDVAPDPTNYVLQIREDGINYWEWYLIPKGTEALGNNFLSVIPYLPEVQADGAVIRTELDPIVFTIEVLSGQPAVQSEYVVDQANPPAPQGFSVVYAGTAALSLIFAQELDLTGMRIATDRADIPILDDFIDFRALDNRVQAGMCLYYAQAEAELTLPRECRGGQAFSFPVLSSERFWYNREQGGLRNVIIRYNDRAYICSADAERCDF